MWDYKFIFKTYIIQMYASHYSNLILPIKKNLYAILWNVCESGSVSRLVVFDSLRPMHCRPAGSSIHGILQTRFLEWVAISSFRGSSRPRDRTPSIPDLNPSSNSYRPWEQCLPNRPSPCSCMALWLLFTSTSLFVILSSLALEKCLNILSKKLRVW